MEFIITFSLLSTLVRGQDLHPFDINMEDIKSIWESPELQPALEKIKLAFPDVEDFDDSEDSHDSDDVPQSRIAGGQIALPGQFPHYVMVYLDSAYLCGGSLLLANWVLTVRNL